MAGVLLAGILACAAFLSAELPATQPVPRPPPTAAWVQPRQPPIHAPPLQRHAADAAWPSAPAIFFRGDYGGAAMGHGLARRQPPDAVCTNFTDTDFDGHDLHAVHSQDVEECCSACAVTDECLFWTFMPPTTCYLKTSDAGRRSMHGYSSGCKDASCTLPPVRLLRVHAIDAVRRSCFCCAPSPPARPPSVIFHHSAQSQTG